MVQEHYHKMKDVSNHRYENVVEQKVLLLNNVDDPKEIVQVVQKIDDDR